MERGQPNSSLTIALCASIVAHGVALYLMAWFYLKYPPSLRLSALARPRPLALAPIIIEAPPPKPPPPPEDFSNATKEPLRDDSGEADGKGTANRSTPGDRPMEARQGLEQANLTRSSKTDPTDSKLDETAVPLRTGTLAVSDATSSQPDVPEFGVGSPQTFVPRAPEPPHPQPTGADIEIKGHSPRASDTDSFAMVAKSNSIHFRDGKMDARQGRKVKTLQPNFGLAARDDVLSLVNPTAVWGVTVNESGDPTNVKILHSSGSPNIDQAEKDALYYWWFEPKKDKNGRGMPDLWVVTIE